jgi:hypothetical protein
MILYEEIVLSGRDISLVLLKLSRGPSGFLLSILERGSAVPLFTSLISFHVIVMGTRVAIFYNSLFLREHDKLQ